MDCSPFLNWQYNPNESDDEQTIVFRSLVATVKLQPALDDSLEAKAVQFMEYALAESLSSTDPFLVRLASFSDDSSTHFVESIFMLLSSPSRLITAAALKMLNRLIALCSVKSRLALVQADLIPQLIITLNPQSLPFVETEDIRVHLSIILRISLRLTTLLGLKDLEIERVDEQQAVHETIFQQVVVPSAKFIWHLCVNRFSIIDFGLSTRLLNLLTNILRICPYYQPTMDFVLRMPVVLPITSCLTFFEKDRSIRDIVYSMNDTQREWNETRGKVRQMWKTVHLMLRMEGIEDVIEEKLRNDKSRFDGGKIVAKLISLNNKHGMNLPQLRTNRCQPSDLSDVKLIWWTQPPQCDTSLLKVGVNRDDKICPTEARILQGSHVDLLAHQHNVIFLDWCPQLLVFKHHIDDVKQFCAVLEPQKSQLSISTEGPPLPTTFVVKDFEMTTTTGSAIED
ncbi:hypothetical protein BLNAU_24504 [Blattamonas nauphoetae]|uniref:FPL domain-containing protein n=1 Tax=Blattamonas nauphoetae TaxID=2049346 RepID=A0ABQ9WM88_9EUKA|nr:hypothetical protein BLNAU_24504 [Blattamonas nauphoetae]